MSIIIILYLGFFYWIGNIFGDILSYKERKERKGGRGKEGRGKGGRGKGGRGEEGRERDRRV